MSTSCNDLYEWIKMESQEEIAVVGITSLAQKEMGEIVYVELPKLGSYLKKEDQAAVLESTKAATDIYSPISGKVIAVNEALLKDPSLINRFPESEGWIFKLLLTASASEKS